MRLGVWPLAKLLVSTILLVALMAATRPVGASEPERSTVRQLIERLASPNPAPVWPDNEIRHEPVYSPNYDHSAQVGVVRAWDALLERGEEAFPDLVASLDDRRYSLTDRGYGFWGNRTVGRICFKILQNEVEVYSRFMRREDQGRHVPSWIMSYQNDAETMSQIVKPWWLKHKGKTLRELQLHGTLWAIDYESKKGFEDGEEEYWHLSELFHLQRRLQISDQPIRVGRGREIGPFLGEDRTLEPGYFIRRDGYEKKLDDPFAPH